MFSLPKTLRDVKELFLKHLSLQYDEEELGNLFFLSAEDILHFSRLDSQLKLDYELDETAARDFVRVASGLLEQRPIQYLLGSCDFYDLKFFVNENVLIPRQETEELVDWILKDCKGEKATIRLLDIGTGSGCIAISLKKNLPNAHVTAFDISPEALAVAKKNASLNAVEIDFVEYDILSQNEINKSNEKYDVIVSNPPYVMQTERKLMASNVLDHEPHLALFVSNENPLQFYEAIANFAQKNLRKNSLIYFEINEAMGAPMLKLMQDKGFVECEIRKDLNGKDRMMKAKLV